MKKLKLLIVLALTSFLIPSLYAQKENVELRIINEPKILNEPFSMPLEYSEHTRNLRKYDRHISGEFPRILPASIDSILSQLLQNVLDEAIFDYDIKGLSAALSIPNGDIWKGASGISHDTVELTTDMLFGIASNTKNFTASIIMQLYEADSLKLTDSIYKWLPNFNNIDSTVTIRQLLNHTSGIYNKNNHPGYFDSVFVVGSRIWTPEELLENFVLSPSFPPGTDWEYSNTNYILLGMIIEEITGNEMVSELHDRLTIPLGLENTFLFPDEGYEGFRSHVWIPDGNNIIDVTEFIDTTGFSASWTGGGIVSTAEDLVKWSKGLNEGEILNDTTLALMRVPAPYSGGYYGLGTQIAPLYTQWIYGHTGDLGYYSRLFYVPEDSLSISVISNQRFAPVSGIWLDLYITYMDYVASQSCLPNGITFSTQDQIDNFQTNYTYCIEIGGDVVISGSDITNLDGLSTLRSIDGDLEIHTNEILENLSGLHSLGSINGNFKVYQNDVLTDIKGLEKLSAIDGDLEIHTNEVLENLSGLDSLGSINGNFKVYLNDALIDFTGIENLSTIDGNLVIGYNPLLNSLAGLDNIEPGSINNLNITNNDKLSYCKVESICKYLINTEGNVNIHDNAPGCDSEDEVELACTTSVDEAHLSEKLLIYPNPSSTQITIELPNTPQKNALLTIYNINAQQMITSKITEQKTVIDISDLPNGFYFIKVSDDRTMMVGRIVKK